MTIRILNNHVVLQTPDPAKLQVLFPEVRIAEVKGQTFCAVPHTLETARVFNNLGYKVPSPIRTQYEWPGKFTPLPHQVHTAEFLTLNTRAFCLNDMGTMKTLSSLWALDYLQKIKEVNKALIVVPLSTLDPTWGKEIFCNFPFKKYTILYGSRQRRQDLLETDSDIYVLNHDGVDVLHKELCAREDIDLIILDELAVYREQRTRRWKTMNNLLNKCATKRTIWGMTGAPTPNSPTDAYAQMKLIKPENYKGSFTSFKHETLFQVSQFKWVPKKGSETSVNRIMQPSLRYELKDCVDLPECLYTEHYAQLSSEQMKHYKELLKKAVTEVRGVTVTAVNAAVLLGKIMQAALGVMYGADGTIVKIDFGPRIKVIKELIEGCSQKVIVFVPLTGALNAIASELRKKWSVDIIDGSVSVTKRNKIFQAFRMTKDPHILVANAGAMSHGLTLTEASLIIWAAPVTSHDTYVQANARIVRPGQKFPTQIAHVHATSEEQRMYSALKERGRLQDLVLDLARNGNSK